MELEQAGVPSVAVHTHVFARLAQVGRARQRHAAHAPGLRAAAGRRSLAAEQLRGYIEGTDPVSRRPFMQEVIEGADAAARRRRPQGPHLRAHDPAAARARYRRQSAAAVHREQLDRLPARSSCRPRSASRRMLKGTSHAARQGRRPAAADGVPRILGIHGREGRGQRRDGGRQAGISAGDPRARRQRRHRALEQHDLAGDDLAWSMVRSATRSA